MLCLVVLIAALSAGEAARILVVVLTSSYSHQIIFQPIYKELAKRGHDIVVVTTDPIKEEVANIKTIDLSFTYKIMLESYDFFENSKNPLRWVTMMYDTISICNEAQLSHPEVQAIIKNETEHFDLLIAEFLFPSMYAFKHRFNCPFIGITSLDAFTEGHIAVGNPVHSTLYPHVLLPGGEDMSFVQRLLSVGFSNVFNFISTYNFEPFENERVRKYFGEGYPTVEELRNSVDMLFINVNLVFNYIRPVTPATIIIGGGLHISPEKPLPKDLKQFLDNESRGVVYFSLGSNVKSKDMPIEMRQKIMKALSELPYKVLWKFENEEMPDQPANVKIMKWIPQQDVLRHKNIKAFITQGGLQSLEEALFSNIPVVGIPFFADQEANVDKVTSKGLGLSLDRSNFTPEELKAKILEVIDNPKYKNRAKELASLVRDEPMNALEKSVWWIEYVIRNKGAQHLKGRGANMPLYCNENIPKTTTSNIQECSRTEKNIRRSRENVPEVSRPHHENSRRAPTSIERRCENVHEASSPHDNTRGVPRRADRTDENIPDYSTLHEHTREGARSADESSAGYKYRRTQKESIV